MGKSRNDLYEMMIILKPLLPDDARKEIHKSITDLCEKLNGKVEDTNIWGKRYLSYKIAGHQEGYYILYTLSLPSSSVKEIDKQMSLKQEIIRYLFVKVDEDEIQKSGIKKKEMELISN
jgi:small subunit ribosomal protein S6